MIQFEGIEKHFGPQVLFSALSWHIRPGERIGLVGPNGAGKTTMVRMLAGLEQPDKGTIRGARRATIGYLPQEVHEMGTGSILDQAMSGQGEVGTLEARMHQIAELLSVHPPREEAERLTSDYGELQDRFAALGGYEMEARVKAILTGLGFDPDKLDRPVLELSGGWQMRVALARLLLQEPDLLLLDEPTNHLDLESLEWLEDFLRTREGAFVVISHDRYFLNRMVQRIAELSMGKLTLFTGNYDHYIIERENRYAAVEAAARNQAKEIEKMTRFIDRFRYQATKARQVQSRIKLLDKLDRVEAPARDSQSVRFQFPQPPRSGGVVMSLRDLVKRYGDVQVYNGIDFSLRRGDRVALVGPNGAGKTTLLKILAGSLPFEGGERVPGHNVTMAYYAQHTLDALDPRNTVFTELSEAAETHMQPRIRGILAAFLFDSEEWEKKVSVLSGGEKARLALAKLLLRPANLLLLDEPTNHLDLRSRDVLENALATFAGTICFISHDRYFINRIATSICDVDHGVLETHDGNYDEHREWKAKRVAALAAAADAGRATAESRPATAARQSRGQKTAPGIGSQARHADPEPQHEAAQRPAGKKSREERRREAETRQKMSLLTRDLRQKIEKIEARIAEHEKKLRVVQFEMASPAVYQDARKAKGAAALQAELEGQIAVLTGEWEKLTEEMEAAAAQVAAATAG